MNENEFYQRGRWFRSEKGESKDLISILPKDLVLASHKDVLACSDTKSCYTTPFEGVEIVPYSEVQHKHMPWVEDFLAETLVRIPATPRFYAERLLKHTELAVQRAWDPKKFHVISHSSGYDTRLISIAVKNLYHDLGDEWLGDLVFVEGDGEAPQTRQIIDKLGWGDWPFYVYNAEVDVHEYHARSIDFEKVWERFNGISGFPLNVWYDPYEWFQERGLIPSDDKIQCFTGYGSNEIAKAFNNFGGFKWYTNWVYHHPLSIFKLKGEWVHPYYHIPLWRNLAHYRKWRYRNCGIAKYAIKYVSPETWGMGGMGIVDREPTVRLLSQRLINQAINDYDHSWYGREVHPGIRPATMLMDYSPWWGEWCLASLCEHLLSAGYSIEGRGTVCNGTKQSSQVGQDSSVAT